MIRILQCVNDMHRAGLETMLMNYYRNIDRNEIQFDFLTHRPNRSDYDDEIESLGGKVYYAPRLYPQNYLSYFKYMKEFYAKSGQVAAFVEKNFGFDLMRYGVGFFNKSNQISYDEAWNKILTRKPETEKNVPGAFVGWDNTPRKGERGEIFVGDTPEKFEKYLTQQIIRAKNIYRKDMIFMYAWNEWAEGGYLEPDTRSGYKNLEAIKNALKSTNEFPW